jgi:hypothetical protein
MGKFPMLIMQHWIMKDCWKGKKAIYQFHSICTTQESRLLEVVMELYKFS